MKLVPPSSAAREAEEGLEMRQEFGRGGTMVGVSRARDLKNRKELSPDTIKRMVSYFARHEVDKDAEGFRKGEKGYPSAGLIAWKLWGGDPGKKWAESMLRKLNSEQTEGVIPMIDVKVLESAEIRRIDGKRGIIGQVSLPWVTVEWIDGSVESFRRSSDEVNEDIEVRTLDQGWVTLGKLVGIFESAIDDESDEDAVEESDEDEDFDSLMSELRSMLGGRVLSEASAKAMKKAKEAAKKKAAAKAAKSKGKGKKKGNSEAPWPPINNKNPKNPFHRAKVIGLYSPSKKKRAEKKRWKCSGDEERQVCVALKDIPEQNIKKGDTKIITVWANKDGYTKKYQKGRKSGKYRHPGDGEIHPVVTKHYRPTGTDDASVK